MSTLKVDAIGKFDTTANAITFDSNNNASFTGSINATNSMMNKNLLINGGMNVWQRSTSETGKSTTAYYTVDRWRFAAASAGTWTLARSTDVPTGQGFTYSYKLDCTTANASLSAGSILQIQQRLEGQNLQHIMKGTSSAKKLTLSFWVKSNKTGTFIAMIYDNDNTRVICKSYTIDAANTWEKKELTFDGDTTGALDNDNDYSVSVALWLVAGSDYTSGTLQTTWGSSSSANQAVGQTVNLADSTSNEILLTGFQLETGSQATNFEFEPWDTTLTKCQRYYEKSYEYDTAPGTATFDGAYYDETGGTNYPRIQAHYRTPKRVRGGNSVVVYNPNTGTPAQMYIWDNGAARYYSWGNTRYTYTSLSTEGQNNAFNLNNRSYGVIHFTVDCEI